MRYKLIALDIDGTILPRNRILPERNKTAVLKAVDSGIKVVLATGRGFKASKPVYDELGLTTPIINYGGALIIEPFTGDYILSTSISPDLVNEALELANKLSLHAHIYEGDTIIYERESVYATKYCQKLKIDCRIDPDIRLKRFENIPKVLFYAPEYTDYYMKVTREHFNGRLAVTGSLPGFIEINSMGADKGIALKYMADMYKIDIRDTAAMGDNAQDIGMLQVAGLSAVPSDASTDMLEIADMVVGKCADASAADFIEYILNENELY